jgi:hypothetical protein
MNRPPLEIEGGDLFAYRGRKTPVRCPLFEGRGVIAGFIMSSLFGWALAGCRDESGRVDVAPVRATSVTSPAISPPKAAERGPFRFEDITAQSGVDFIHVSGTTPEKLLPTANGSGVAIFDADGDGKFDLYFATGNLLPLAERPIASNRFYKNLGGGKFRDETPRSGLGFRGYCHGITVGDIDNDGRPDVFLANYGGDALFHNRGDGTYEDISRASGLRRPGTWSSSAAFLDYDGDGDLDLYVSRYGDWQYPRDKKFCGDFARKIRRYCSPKELATTRHSLFRNEGHGTFRDVTLEAGIARDDGHGFAVVAGDLDGDGRTDLYVANDQDPNFLFLNAGNGTFRDATVDSGAALSVDGRTQAGMGVDAEDLDGDGLPELFVTNFADEYNTVYRNLGRGMFADATARFGMAADSLPWIGWGCALIDLDRDGWPDAVVANGHIDDNAGSDGSPVAQAEPALLHQNVEGRRFRLATAGAGPYFATDHIGRGLAYGDIDDDGDIDLVISHKDGMPAVLRNDSPNSNRWLRLRLVGTRSNRDAVGARIEVVVGGRTMRRLQKSGHGLMSSHDPRLLIGIGPSDVVDRVIIRWPSGTVSELVSPTIGRTVDIVEPVQVR